MRRVVFLSVVLVATVTLCAVLFAPPAPKPSPRSPLRKEAAGLTAYHRRSPRLPPRGAGAPRPAEAGPREPPGGTITRLLHQAGARQGEVVLQLRSPASFEAAREGAKKHGVAILDEDEQLLALRLGFGNAAQIEDLLNELDPSDYAADANYVVFAPPDPSLATPKNPGQDIVPFENRARAWLGIEGDNPDWGKGVTIAILDSGVVNDGAFAPAQVQSIALHGGGESYAGVFGHGTAVASVAAGNDPAALGIAPAADLLSYEITDASGQSDSFTLARAIYDAVDKGADIINVSMGSYGDSSLMRNAVEFASANGVLVVASAGNAGLDRLAYPAAYPGVVSVGAVDALGQHLYYSNASDTLSLAAPGAGVVADWPNVGQVLFSGTSASAPYVSGALAAVMSQNPGMTAAEARDLLFAYANEAGPAGRDAEFGNGLLQIGRVMERNQPGIFDVAVASQTFASSPAAVDGAGAEYDVVVQNRGTEPLYGTRLDVTVGGAMQAYRLPLLSPGGIFVQPIPIDLTRARNGGSIDVISSVTVPGQADRNPTDNRLGTRISIQPPS
jgi:hypothetical protein